MPHTTLFSTHAAAYVRKARGSLLASLFVTHDPKGCSSLQQLTPAAAQLAHTEPAHNHSGVAADTWLLKTSSNRQCSSTQEHAAHHLQPACLPYLPQCQRRAWACPMQTAAQFHQDVRGHVSTHANSVLSLAGRVRTITQGSTPDHTQRRAQEDTVGPTSWPAGPAGLNATRTAPCHRHTRRASCACRKSPYSTTPRSPRNRALHAPQGP
jgi:hypothetical protein